MVRQATEIEAARHEGCDRPARRGLHTKPPGGPGSELIGRGPSWKRSLDYQDFAHPSKADRKPEGIGKTQARLCGRTKHAAEICRWGFGLSRWRHCPMTSRSRLAVATALGLELASGHGIRRSRLERATSKADDAVLDNCEHVVEEVGRMAEALLRATGQRR